MEILCLEIDEHKSTGMTTRIFNSHLSFKCSWERKNIAIHAFLAQNTLLATYFSLFKAVTDGG